MAKKKAGKLKPNTLDVEIDGNVNGENVLIGSGNTIYLAPEDRTRTNALRQITQPPADFTGREMEIKILLEKIKTGGVTITGMQGMGGIGKTVLALKLADELKSECPDAQFYLDLQGTDKQNALTPAQAMAHVILSVFPKEKLPEDNQQLRALFNSTLNDMRAILFWDNARDAEQVKPLSGIPNCLTLVTSRQHFTLPGLDALNLEVLSEHDAVALIKKIAPRIEKKDAAEIAKRCGYLPLAMRVAASLLTERPDVSPQKYISRLEEEKNRLSLVEASLLLSVQFLDELQQRRFSQMGVFATSFSREAVFAVWEANEDDADSTIGVFLKHSLLEFDGEASRYYLHDLVKDFARRELRQAGNSTPAFQNLANWLIALFDEHFTDDPDSAPHVVLEMDNLRHVIDWALAGRQGETLARLATKTRNWLYNYYRNFDEWLSWLQSSLEFGFEDDQLKANVLQAIGDVQQFRDDRDAALVSYNEALKLFREIGDKLGEANVYMSLGDASLAVEKWNDAIKYYEQALPIYQTIQAQLGQANTLIDLGKAYFETGEQEKGMGFVKNAGDLFAKIGSGYWAIRSYRRLAEMLRQCNRAEEANQIEEQLNQIEKKN